MAGSDHYFHTRLSHTFQNIEIQNNFQVKIVIATGGILDLVDWIIVLYFLSFFQISSGYVAERVDLRYFLSFGMVMSGVFTMLFGFAKYWDLHSYGYFIFIQVYISTKKR